MIICKNWIEYVKQVLNHAGHGYEYYCAISIPTEKKGRLEMIDKKIIAKYPMIEWGKDRRYRAKKAGEANYAYIRWQLFGIIMHTVGREVETLDRDTFFSLAEKPYVIKIGSWLDIKP